MDKLLQTSLHSRKTKEVGRMVAKPFKVLHMDRLEETREEKEKPYPTWNRPRNGLWMESHKNGGWAVAQSPILRTTITIKRLEKRGYVSLVNYYKLASIIIEPPSTRPLRLVV
jgi:hypothetical protein